jgi:hypothetical protein
MLLRASLLACFVAHPLVTLADTQQRTIVVRERASASFLNDEFTFKVLKIRGYTIKVRVGDGENRELKLGESISPESSECAVVFEEIATETRIARFTTDCL